MFKGSDLVFKIPSLDMEHVYYDLIPNLFIFQALYGDLGGLLVKKKPKQHKPSGLHRGETAKKERLKGEG